MTLVNSQIFRRTIGAFLVLSLPAVYAITATMQARVETESKLAHERMAWRQLQSFANRVQRARALPETLELITQTLLDGQTLQLLLKQQSQVLTIDGTPITDFTVNSVVRTAAQQQRSLRYIVPDGQDRSMLAVCLRLEWQANEYFLMLTSDPAASLTAQARTGRMLREATVAAWIICLICLMLAISGTTRPMQQMSDGLKPNVDRHEREDMLLQISDRQDELGEISAALFRLENELHTRIKTLEQTRRHSQGAVDLLTAVLESMIEGVIATDREQRMVFLNGGARRLLSIGDLIGPGHRLYEAVRIPPFLDIVQEALSSGEARSLEYRNPRDHAHHLLVATPILQGPHAGVVAVIRDVSDVRRLEAMRRDFVNGVSHELKTPLTVIQACSDTLRNGALQDPQSAERFLTQIDEQSDRLLQLILTMLQLSRVESGSEILRFEPVDLAQIIRETTSDFQTIASSRNLQLNCHDIDPILVRTDHQAARTVIGNLVDNALRYTPAGGTVSIAVKPDVRGVNVSISDSGDGIPETLLGRIFERFYRVEQDRSREKGGSGLGLSIVKHLCNSLHARISVESTVGTGSTFTVWFPRVQTFSISPAPETRKLDRQQGAD